MSLSIPGLTISTTPNKFSPVYGPNWWTFNGIFATTSAIQNTSQVFADVLIMNQGISLSGVSINAGRFKVPARTDSFGNPYYILNTENILKTFVTFPYDSGASQSYGSNPPAYVNETTGLTATGNYPYISPEPEGIVKYCLNYGLEYNPNFRFQQLVNIGTTSSFYFSLGSVNHFCQVGDTITIIADSGLYSYWNGTASVLSIFDDGFGTFILTDQIPNIPLVTSSGGHISGSFTLVQHYFGVSNDSYAYNGVRQWDQNNIDFGNLYAFSNIAPPAGTFQFMNDYGKDKNHCIPIMPGQGERTRFLADFLLGATAAGTTALNLEIDTYDINGVTVSSSLTVLQSTVTGLGLPFPHKCYTVQLFDQIGTITVVDGYKYKFSMYDHFEGVTHSLAQIWYCGYNPPNKYNNYRIKFLNRQGTWAYWNFNKDAQQTTQISRTEYKRPLQYDYSINFTKPGYSTSKLRGQAVLSSEVQETFTLNTDWITEDAYAYLAQLVTSPEVYIFYDTYTQADGTVLTGVNIPVIMTLDSHLFKTRFRDKLFNLTIPFKYAFDTKIQNQ